MKIGRFLHICKGGARFRGAALAAFRLFAYGKDKNRYQIRFRVTFNSQRLDLKTGCQLVGTHTGRRTFIVNALSLGITPNIVMKWTGHSDHKAMKPYIDIVDSIKASSMTKFDGLI